MAGVHQQLFAGGEIALDEFAGEVEPDDARARHLLQDKAVAAEETGAEAFLPGEFERHRLFGDEECLLAADERLAGLKQRGHDRAGKARREGDMPGPLRREIGDEKRAAAEGALETGEEAAAGMRVHRNLIVHPGHGVGLAIDGLARGEIDRHRLHDIAGYFIAHWHAPSVRQDRRGSRLTPVS